MITSAEMAIWVLTLWGAHLGEFEGGQYVTEERCKKSGPPMVQGLRMMYGPLEWKCERKMM